MRKITRILLPIVFLLIIILFAVFAGAHFLFSTVSPAPEASGFYDADFGRGLVISTGEGADFPSAAGLKSATLKAELEAMLDYAQQNGYQAVYFEATDGSSAFYRSKVLPASTAWTGDEKSFTLFDPLKYLCSQAAQRDLEVYALADLRNAGDAAVCGELARYALSGIVLYSGETDDAIQLCRLARTAIDETAEGRKLGMIIPEGTMDAASASSLAREAILDLALPVFESDTDGRKLEEWASAFQNSSAKLALYQPLEKLNNAESIDELGFRLLLASMDDTATGTVFDHYGSLLACPGEAEQLISYFADGGTTPDFSLTFDQTLAVRAPAQDTIWLDSTYTSYFISGTSDPSLPLSMNGEELERQTGNGVWGVLAQLNTGNNIFTFAQGDEKVNVTIVVYDQKTAVPITEIRQSSLFPAGSRAYRVGDEINFTCIAPSGGAVTANINGTAVYMKQNVATAMRGVAAVFSGSYTIPAGTVPADEVADLGSVTYTLNYNGAVTTYESAGNLLAAGERADIVATVDDIMIGVYNNATGDGDLAANLNRGTRMNLRGEYEGNRALLQDWDVFVPLDSITILTGSESAQQVYHGPLTCSIAEKGEEFLLGDKVNTYLVSLEEDTLTVVLRDTLFEDADNGLILLNRDPSAEGGTDEPESRLFCQIAAQNNEDGTATLTMKLAPGVVLSGWDIYTNSSGQAVLYCQQAAALSDTYARPLEGITIMVDPGHGGEDIGAPGAAGSGGPTEAEVNLALSAVLRYRLEQLGATVVMTQDDNSRITIYERYELAQQVRPDLFISVHHNSIAATRDANEIYYTTGYYFYPQSEYLAVTAAEEVHRRIGRDLIESRYAAYYVTRMSSAPSILFETGFVSNPREQEECSDTSTIYQTACALADAIQQALARQSALS